MPLFYQKTVTYLSSLGVTYLTTLYILCARRLAENDVTEYMARCAMRDDALLLRAFKASGTVYQFLYHNRKQ